MNNIINYVKELVQQAQPVSSGINTIKCVAENLDYYRLESEEVIKIRIRDLDSEWDVERSVQLKASLIALGGIALGVALGKKWLMIPAAMCSFFAVQAIQGGAIPVSGNFRTRKQIAEEQFGLKELLTKGAYKNLDSNNF